MPLRPLDALNRLRYRHHIDIFNGTAVRGWILQPGNPRAPSLVAAYHNGKRVSAVTQTVQRPDLTRLGWGPVAFTVSLTCASLETVQLRVARPNGPKLWTTVERTLKRPVGIGALDGFVENKVRGWAASFQPGDHPFHVLVCAGDEVVVRTRPYLLRQDAADAIAYHSPRIGFEASVPWRHSAFSKLTVVGETLNSRFAIGDIGPSIMENGFFSQSFRYRSDINFWL